MNDALREANRKMLGKLGLLAFAMFGFGFALVPLYGVFCDLTGLNRDADQALGNNTQVDTSRWVKVQLITNVQNGDIWHFTPPHTVTVHPGQLTQVAFELDNQTDRYLLGRAVPSFGPREASLYFKKIVCFCFHEEHLAPHEKAKLPLIFVIDRNLPADLKVVTVSYTLFQLPTKADV